MATAEALKSMQLEADRLIEAGAPGVEFERLHTAGWRAKSAQEGSGLGPCPSDCGVCNPVFSPTRRKVGRR